SAFWFFQCSAQTSTTVPDFPVALLLQTLPTLGTAIRVPLAHRNRLACYRVLPRTHLDSTAPMPDQRRPTECLSPPP
ncbi:hypothetical protein D039_0329B, partial [Vibrio parahaemolyticus EKP-028]